MSRPAVVFMFSGQGSHYYQMGRELYERHASFRRRLMALDAAAQDLADMSVVALLYDDRRKKTDTFDHTPHTHPAIFLVEVALAQALMEEGISPDYALGASLGVFAAAVTARCLDVETALVAVMRQARLLHERCQPGAMIAILERPEFYNTQGYLRENCAIASFNFPSHFVVATPRERLAGIESNLRNGNIGFQTLPVARAFHSRWIDAARLPYLEYLRGLSLRQAVCPLVSCVGASVGATLERDSFWNAVRAPIRFQQTIEYLEHRQPLHYVDVGPSGTLATFVKYNLSSRPTGSAVFSILTPFGQDLRNLQSLKARNASTGGSVRGTGDQRGDHDHQP